MNELQAIKDYIDSNNLGEAERRFLINYMVNVIRSSEDVVPIDYVGVVADVRKLNEYLMSVEDTSLVRKRIQQELDILTSLAGAVVDENKLVDASYKLDQLYYESDMPFRNTDTVFRKVNTEKGRGK